MDIVYTTNDRFVPKVAAGICSIFENNREQGEITVYILTDEITPENKSRFHILEKTYQRRIVIINIGDIRDYFPFKVDTLGWNPVVLSRLLIQRFLPDNLERVLYLDGDTIVNGDLEELWNTDLENCILGGCIEPTVDKNRIRELGMYNTPYINAGVLLIDLKAWKINEAEKRILKYYKENDGILFANDQDAINGALKGQIFFLPPKYNFYNIYWQYPYKFLKKLMGSVYYYNNDVYEESVQNPIIIHYLGEERPWRKGNKHKYRFLYHKYLYMTEWNNSPEEDGWQIYFICWYIFNSLMKFFPEFRYKIINGLIPLVMKWRGHKLKKNNEK